MIRNVFGFSLLLIIGSIAIIDALVIDIYQIEHNYNEKLINDVETLQVNEKNETVALYKFLNAEYYGEIGIGHPKQTFKVVFDTSWADSWVPSQQCGYFELACMIHTRYDHTKSSTYRENGANFSVESAELSLQGFWSVDDLHLDHLKVPNQTFIEMTHMSMIPFMTAKADGIIGLAWDSLAKNGTRPFFSNMIDQGIIEKKIFTFYMNNDETTNRAGRLILGGTERSHVKGNITFLPVIGENYWRIAMDKLVVTTTDSSRKSYTFCDKGCQVTLDTSANTISGPESVIKSINHAIGATQIMPTWPYKFMVDCREFSKLPQVTFVFGGKNFTIQSKYYVQHLVYKGFQVCLSPFVMSPTETWELGGAFLMQFYSEFHVDKKQVGIAETLR